MLCACSGAVHVRIPSSTARSTSASSKAADKDPGSTLHATVGSRGYEPFVIDLYPEYAPKTVENFCNLAKAAITMAPPSSIASGWFLHAGRHQG